MLLWFPPLFHNIYLYLYLYISIYISISIYLYQSITITLVVEQTDLLIVRCSERSSFLFLFTDWDRFVAGKQSGHFWEVRKLIHDSGWWVSTVHGSHWELLKHCKPHTHLYRKESVVLHLLAVGRFSIKPQGGTLHTCVSACFPFHILLAVVQY